MSYFNTQRPGFVTWERMKCRRMCQRPSGEYVWIFMARKPDRLSGFSVRASVLFSSEAVQDFSCRMQKWTTFTTCLEDPRYTDASRQSTLETICILNVINTFIIMIKPWAKTRSYRDQHQGRKWPSQRPRPLRFPCCLINNQIWSMQTTATP